MQITLKANSSSPFLSCQESKEEKCDTNFGMLHVKTWYVATNSRILTTLAKTPKVVLFIFNYPILLNPVMCLAVWKWKISIFRQNHAIRLKKCNISEKFWKLISKESFSKLLKFSLQMLLLFSSKNAYQSALCARKKLNKCFTGIDLETLRY